MPADAHAADLASHRSLISHGVHSALVTGAGRNKTTLPTIRTDLASILTAFSPRSKERGEDFADEGEIQHMPRLRLAPVHAPARSRVAVAELGAVDFLGVGGLGTAEVVVMWRLFAGELPIAPQPPLLPWCA